MRLKAETGLEVVSLLLEGWAKRRVLPGAHIGSGREPAWEGLPLRKQRGPMLARVVSTMN